MKLLERKVDLITENSWYQWGDCSDIFDVESTFDIMMSLDDFIDLFNKLNEEEKHELIFEKAVYQHNECVYFVGGW